MSYINQSHEESWREDSEQDQYLHKVNDDDEDEINFRNERQELLDLKEAKKNPLDPLYGYSRGDLERHGLSPKDFT